MFIINVLVHFSTFSWYDGGGKLDHYNACAKLRGRYAYFAMQNTR